MVRGLQEKKQCAGAILRIAIYATLVIFIGTGITVARSTAASVYQAERVKTPVVSPARDARMARFRQAKFGMFIHWGLMAEPNLGTHDQMHKNLSAAQYARHAANFNPVQFNAREWIDAARSAGMRYVVLTAKHHAGFCLWDSKVTDFDVMDASPLKRDIVGELAEACAEADLPLGFYYSQAQDWHHPGGSAYLNTFTANNSDATFEQYIDTISLPQARELLTRYGPVFTLWYDTPVEMTPAIARRFIKLQHALQPDTYSQSRLLYHGFQIPRLDSDQLDGLADIGVDYLSYGDHKIPDHPQWRDWETCMTLSQRWDYEPGDQAFKTPQTIIRMLSLITARGGNFLLNVAPDPQGHLRPQEIQCLATVGEWLKIHGEAIYGAEPGEYRQTVSASGKQGAHALPVEWCMTRKGDFTYLFLLNHAETDEFAVNGVDQHYRRAVLLDDPDTPLNMKQDGHRLTIMLPPHPPGDGIRVLRLQRTE